MSRRSGVNRGKPGNARIVPVKDKSLVGPLTKPAKVKQTPPAPPTAPEQSRYRTRLPARAWE
jgi:hypothetical protein